LSDLLTPWAEIERRVEAAAAADFVLCLYNPVSLKRQGQLGRAREILLAHRPADTPVVIARNLGRRGESVEPIRLGDLVAERLDMLSIAIVGNSRTRLFERGQRTWVYTPRGYGAERGRGA
ncbi:MAG: SAM-dependent methyltransferase, partial [Alphaproteobacteria bacterium]